MRAAPRSSEGLAKSTFTMASGGRARAHGLLHRARWRTRRCSSRRLLLLLLLLPMLEQQATSGRAPPGEGRQQRGGGFGGRACGAKEGKEG